MKKIELFEPAMCCESGVCGPSVNQELLTITSAFAAMKGREGLEAERYNLSGDPSAFAKNEEIMTAMKQDETALPITVVDGRIVKKGSYPSLEELSQFTGLVFVPASEKRSTCCGGNGNGCC